ncbi:hypothetical protein BG000_010677 [Podila horticola]|nr:hypothetical protein BG000_010677 [Podila horticola]
MLDVPELDRMVYRHLDSLDLFQCTLVNRNWYDVAMPFLWTKIPTLRTQSQRQALRKLVLIDYIQEREHQKQQQEKALTEGTASAYGSTNLSAQNYYSSLLEEYGGNVVEAPCLVELAEVLYLVNPDAPDCQRTKYTLVIQFLKRCPNLRVPILVIPKPDLTNNYMHRAVIIPYVVPMTQALIIGLCEADELPWPWTGQRTGHFPSVDWSNLDLTLKAVSSPLVSLTLRLSVCGPRAVTWDYETGFVGLKELRILGANGPSEFWSNLWIGCRQIELLQVYRIEDSTWRCLVESIKHMAKLDSITFGNHNTNVFDPCLSDSKVAKLIGAGTKGWRVVESDSTSVLGPKSMEALAQHFSTLVEISIVQSTGGSNTARFLVLCPNLQKVIVAGSTALGRILPSDVNVLEFIDRDWKDNSLRPWMCESSLKTLRIRITGMPKQRDETFPGQRQSLHSGVYARLARLTKLEDLSLGYRPVSKEYGIQLTPISMTVKSGLATLIVLKNMRFLSLDGLRHELSGNVDIKWMFTHWPRLNGIAGLDPRSEACHWLRMNYPHGDAMLVSRILF